MSNFYMLLTSIGIAKIANSQVTNETIDLTQMAVGDSNGAYYNPTQTATALKNETWRGPVSSVAIDEKNPNWVVIDGVIPASVGGFTIREVGLFDSNGDMIAIGKVPETYKPTFEQGSSKDLYLKSILEVSNASVVNIKADPSVIIASKKYVDDKFAIVSTNVTDLSKSINAVNELVTQHLADYEYQSPTISGTQLRLKKQSNTSRLLFKLDAELNGAITVSLDNGATSKNLVDVDGVQVNSLEKGFAEIVAVGNFFILRNRGLSKSDLQALITLVNEAEANESVLRTQYVNAVNGANQSIKLPAGATWNDILVQIPKINSDRKRFATGTVQKLAKSVEVVKDFGFTPNLIIVNYDKYTTVYQRNHTPEYASMIAPQTPTFTGYTTLLSTVGGYVNSSGFKLPIDYTVITSCVWMAFE